MNTLRPRPEHVLSYERPLARERRVSWLFIFIIAFPFLAAGCVWTAISVTQRIVGQSVLFYPATGTHAYDFWLIAVPFLVVTSFYIVIAIWGVLWVVRGWLKPSALALLLPVCAIAWFLFLVACVPIWDEMSP